MHLLQRVPPVRFSAETRRECWWQSMVESRLSVKTRLCFIYLFSFWQAKINKQTLTQHDIAGSLFPRSSFGCLVFFCDEWSKTEHDRNTVKADGFVSQSFAQYFIPPVSSSGAARAVNMRCHYFQLFQSYIIFGFISSPDSAKHLLPAISQ